MQAIPLRDLLEAARRRSRQVAGVLSGTSIDSVHIAFCTVRGAGLRDAKVDLNRLVEIPYDTQLRNRLLRPDKLSVRDIAELNVELGAMFGRALIKAAKKASIDLGTIDLIGSHGQTVYHHSNRRGASRATLQIGDGDVIAEICGVPVISDFRARDIACGGEGAPLTPYADSILYRPEGKTKQRLVLNLGGVANVTVLSSHPEKIRGFDTGPANAPLDRLARIISRGRLRCDLDGQIAARGTIDEKFVKRLIEQDSYLRKAPPKSTGFEVYGDTFVSTLRRRFSTLNADAMATAADFCARATAYSIKRFVTKSLNKTEIVLAGGGARNPFLVARLKVHCYPADITFSDTLGIPCEAREAMAFAIFANDALCGHATSLPSVTGSRRPAILGKLSWP